MSEIAQVVTDDAVAASVFEAAATRWRERYEQSIAQRDRAWVVVRRMHEHYIHPTLSGTTFMPDGDPSCPLMMPNCQAAAVLAEADA
jgi:hypothetical protein